jgi:hypothetical protein
MTTDTFPLGSTVKLVDATYRSGNGQFGYGRFVGQRVTVVSGPYRIGELEVVDVQVAETDGHRLVQTVETRHLEGVTADG